MDETLWARRECVSAEVDGSLVLLDLETLVYHSLNGTAAAVWSLLEEPRRESSVVEDLCKLYRVEQEQCADSVHRLFQQFAASNLVTPVQAAAGTAV
jgi:hypothetical protein